MQSVPGEGEKPQKFETIAPVQADARLNRLRLLPPPRLASALGQRDRAIAAPDAEALAAAASLAPGDRVILYIEGAIETLAVRAVSIVEDQLIVRFATPIANGQFYADFDAHHPAWHAYKLGRSFHLFGVDAPETVVASFLKTTGDPTSACLATGQTDFSLNTSVSTISLDGRYPGLKPGSVILATAAGATAIPFRVTAVSEKHVTRSAAITTTNSAGITTTNIVVAQSGTVTQLDLAPLAGQTLVNLVPTGNDIRDVVIHELIGPELRFWPYVQADVLASNEVVVSGRRAGWSVIEVGRTIEKGVAKPGTAIGLRDIAVGRSVLLVDAEGGMPASGRVAGVSLVGAGVSLGPADGDATTVRLLGLAPDQATPLTVIASVGIERAADVREPDIRADRHDRLAADADDRARSHDARQRCGGRRRGGAGGRDPRRVAGRADLRARHGMVDR